MKITGMINAKSIMTLSAVVLGTTGVLLTFLPDIVLSHIHISKNDLFILQILGAFYFAFGILNWMVKGSVIGGIYNRPIVMANLAHFSIAGIALIKRPIAVASTSYLISGIAIVYIVFCLMFGILLFRHPNGQSE